MCMVDIASKWQCWMYALILLTWEYSKRKKKLYLTLHAIIAILMKQIYRHSLIIYAFFRRGKKWIYKINNVERYLPLNRQKKKKIDKGKNKKPKTDRIISMCHYKDRLRISVGGLRRRKTFLILQTTDFLFVPTHKMRKEYSLLFIRVGKKKNHVSYFFLVNS